MTLYEKVEPTDDYPRWKVVYDAWYAVPDGADHGEVINLRDMVGEYFDDFMVPVEPTDRIWWCKMYGFEVEFGDPCKEGLAHYHGGCGWRIMVGEPA